MGEQQALARVGEVIADKYRLERLLGAGGMGAVYAATHEFTKRQVAVKLMHASFAESPVFAERFIREAQAPSAIGHSGIVEVLDGGFDKHGALYIVLEMLQGKTLGDLDTPLPVPDLVDVIVQLLDALAAAHKAGFVHRDIKPDNVFLTHNTAGQRKVKLLDFGVAGLRASADNAQLTQTGTILGTPTFMSPEQAKGERVDQRSDLWAVGAILYDALAGRPPYEAETYNAVIVSIVTREHVPLERVRPDLPRALLEVIEHALRKDTAQRWQSAEQMMFALRAIPNLEALSGVVTKQASADAVAKTAVARRGGAVRPQSIDAPALQRPVVSGEHLAPERQAPTPPTTARAARNVTTVAAPDTLSSSTQTPRLGLWIGGATLVIALAVGFAFAAKSSRTQVVEATALQTPPTATTEVPAAASTLQPTHAAAPVAATAAAAPTPTTEPSASPLAATPVEPAPVPALKPLSSDDLAAALASGQAKLERCYQDLMAAALVAGTQTPTAMSLNVTLNVTTEGHVRDVSIEGSAPAKLVDCMRTQLRAFVFRPSSQPTELNFPVVFQPSVITR